MTSRFLSTFILSLVLMFLIGPFLIIIAASLSAGESLAFPPAGFSFKWIIKVFQIESFRVFVRVPSKALRETSTSFEFVLTEPSSGTRAEHGSAFVGPKR